MRAAQSIALPAFEATVAAPPDHVRALEAALVSARAAEERFRGLVESIEAIPYISEWDAAGTLRYISPQVERMLGYAPAQWYHDHDLWESRLHPEDRERVLAASARTFGEARDFACEYRLLAADDRVVWIAERETIVRDERGAPLFCNGVMFDITRLKTAEERLVAAEAELREERDLAHRYFDVARTVLLVLDPDGTVRALNQYGHELLGHPAGSLVGREWYDIALSPEQRGPARDGFLAAMTTTEPQPDDDGESEWQLVTATGELRTMAWRHTILRAPDGHATGSLASGEDITERLRAEAEIRRLAFHDALTGLANRSHFEGELRAAVAGGAAAGLLFLDLDDFKQVNDTFGHEVGDELLCAVADRLAACAPGGLVGRHGGDEFLVLLRDLPPGAAPAAARAAADAVTARLGEPFAIAGRVLRIRASVGCSVYPHEAPDAAALLRRADAAMYRVKRATALGEGA